MRGAREAFRRPLPSQVRTGSEIRRVCKRTSMRLSQKIDQMDALFVQTGRLVPGRAAVPSRPFRSNYVPSRQKGYSVETGQFQPCKEETPSAWSNKRLSAASPLAVACPANITRQGEPERGDALATIPARGCPVIPTTTAARMELPNPPPSLRCSADGFSTRLQIGPSSEQCGTRRPPRDLHTAKSQGT